MSPMFRVAHAGRSAQAQAKGLEKHRWVWCRELKMSTRKKTQTPNGQPLVGSAGPLILKDLGITNAELAAFLPVDAPHWIRGVFWCQVEGPKSLDEIAAHFADRFAITHFSGKKFPPGGPPDGVDVPTISLWQMADLRVPKNRVPRVLWRDASAGFPLRNRSGGLGCPGVE